MTNLLASIVASWSANSISNTFIVTILFVVVVSAILAAKGLCRTFTLNTPNTLTSLGILGTFAGIVVGLMDFNPLDIDGSIGTLLSGLKTAFLTSLVGMFCSIVYKSFSPMFENYDEEVVGEVGPEQILAVMNHQLDASQELLRAIKGSEDASLTSQIRNMRTDIADGNRTVATHFEKQQQQSEQFQITLWQKMEEFGQMLSKSATEQVINALKDVIKDFNNNLTEQFGQNFKRLDESVRKLVDWQENYRIQLEDMAEKYRLGVEAIAYTKNSISEIAEKAESIPQCMESLREVIAHNQAQVIELEQRLEAFKELRDQAVNAMPEIKAQLDKVMGDISSSVSGASEHYTQMLAESQEVISGFTENAENSIKTMKSNLEQGATQLSSELIKSANDMGGKLTEASQTFESNAGLASSNMKQMNNELTTAAEQIQREIKDGMSDLNNVMRATVTGIKEDSAETSKVLKEANQELVKDTRHVQIETKEAFDQMRRNLEQNLSEVFRLQTEQTKASLEGLNGQIDNALKATGDAVNQKVDFLDTEMQKEIVRTVQQMGKALTEVTRQFTKDYKALTQEMGNVVRSARVM
ncbi:hypothetical protein L1D13_10155 [Vibrio tubiashii]|uniref:hypothetical protein n=1 Tax=Vibrio tubiashii TaxID=29498 RepID=UPI001EFC6081|nr:hypothetical protein [Vibrio tubiashii]MCG9581070.1 hypothetical protein [Vibrio tubiashii]MCG9614661.1 hypothetical protein [Vibrio tubiashii]MCG9687288.1 hypothetical protein [Vibrio tubiashii]